MRNRGEYLENIFENIKDAIIGINHKGEIEIINKAAKEMLNLDESNSIGLNIKDIITDKDLLRWVETKVEEIQCECILNEIKYIVRKVPMKKNKVQNSLIIHFNRIKDYGQNSYKFNEIKRKNNESPIEHFKNNRQLKDIVEEMEKDIILECLDMTEGNKNRAAKMLGISRTGLYKKMDRYQITI